MNVGELDRKVVIEQLASSGNVLGAGGSETWSTFKTVWAKVVPMVSRERFLEGGERRSERVATFTMYYISNITPTMRISYDSLTWQIIGIKEIGYKDLLEVEAQALYGV